MSGRPIKRTLRGRRRPRLRAQRLSATLMNALRSLSGGTVSLCSAQRLSATLMNALGADIFGAIGHPLVLNAFRRH